MLLDRRFGGRWAAIAAVFLVGLPLFGLAAVSAGELVPDSVILDQLIEDRAETHLGEQSFGPGYAGRPVDYFSDCLALTMGTGTTEHAWPVASAIASPTLGSCLPTIEALDVYAAGGEPEVWQEYYRYWHGYSTVVRPSVALVGVGGTRLIATVVLWASFFGLAREVLRGCGRRFGAALLVPLVVTTDFVDLVGSLPHSAAMTVTFASTWALFATARRRDDIAILFFGGWLAGAAVVFVDVLTTPVYGFALSTFLVGVASAKVHGRSGGALARRLLATGCGWVTGWVLMWSAKWVIASFVFGFATVRDTIRYQAEFRIDGENTGVVQTFGYSTAKNLGQWLDPTLTKVVFASLVVVGVYQLVQRHRDLRSTIDQRLLLAVPLVAPFVWFELLRNHSQIHSWFTYRSVACVFAGLTALALLELAYPTTGAGADSQRGEIETRRSALG